MTNWVLFKKTARAWLTGTAIYWVRNGDTASVCASVSGSNPSQMAEEAERTAYGVVRRVGGVGLLDNRVFLSGTGKGVQAVSIIDIPLTKKIEQELNRCGLIEAI